MNFLNDGKTVWILPFRTGTRYVGRYLHDLGLIEHYGKHFVKWNEIPADKIVLLNVRNPFTRAISLYKWYEQVNHRRDWKEFLKTELGKRNDTMSITEHIYNNVNRIDKLIHLETMDQDIVEAGFPKPDDVPYEKSSSEKIILDDESVDIITKVFKDDFENFNYSQDPNLINKV